MQLRIGFYPRTHLELLWHLHTPPQYVQWIPWSLEILDLLYRIQSMHLYPTIIILVDLTVNLLRWI